MEYHLARRREAEFQHCGMEAIRKTLKSGPPANGGDLAALAVAELELLSERIRDGSASYWRLFWNVDRYNHTKGARPEESCRDAILFNLQSRLARLGVDVQPEGTYADDKRSDIRVTYGGFNVPVEIKRACHRDLWTAIRTQLMVKYARDPEAAGFGIYLVLWFGQDSLCKPTALDSWIPADAGEVESGLTQQLFERERSRISVCVIDVSNRDL